MSLPDFSQHAKFNRLFEKLGIEERVSLLKVKIAPLPKRGVDLGSLTEVETAGDRTLIYKGHRVFVYIRDQHIHNEYQRQSKYKYHVADCVTLQDMRVKRRYDRYVVSNREDGYFVVNFMKFGRPVELDAETAMEVCRNCLRELNWENYLSMNQYGKNQCADSFSPSKFFEKYPARLMPKPKHTATTAPLSEYGKDWGKVAQRFKSKMGWICQGCRIDLSAPHLRQFLHVHHIDGNKSNNYRSNLQALCVKCHSEQADHGHMRNSKQLKEFRNARTRF